MSVDWVMFMLMRIVRSGSHDSQYTSIQRTLTNNQTRGSIESFKPKRIRFKQKGILSFSYDNLEKSNSLKYLKTREKQMNITESYNDSILTGKNQTHTKGFILHRKLKENEFKFFDSGLLNCFALSTRQRPSITQNQPRKFSPVDLHRRLCP